MNAAVGADERLVVMLEARITEFEKRMAQAEGRGTRSFQSLRRGSRAATQQMERDMIRSTTRINQALAATSSQIGMFARGFAGGIAGGIVATAFAGLRTDIRSVVGEMSNVAKAADRVGMDTDSFQGLRHGLGLAGVTASETTTALETFVERLGDAQQGSGALSVALARNGVSLTDQAGQMKSVNTLLKEFSDVVARAPNAAARMTLVTDAFGRGGRALADAMAAGGAGLEKMIRQAQEGGFVLEEQVLRNAEKLDDQFSKVGDRLGNIFKQGIVNAALFFGFIDQERAKLEFDPASLTGNLGADMAGSLSDAASMGQEALEVIEGLKLEYIDLAAEATAMVPALSEASTMMRGLGREAEAQALADLATTFQDASAALQDGSIQGAEFAVKLEGVTTEAIKTLAALDDMDKARLGGVIGAVQSLLAWIQELPKAVVAARDEIMTLEAMTSGVPLVSGGDGSSLLPPGRGSVRFSPRPRSAPPLLGGPALPTRRGGGGGGGRSVDDYAKAAEAIREETRALEAQAVALIAVAEGGASYANAVEYARRRAELLNAAMKDGKAVTPELTAEIEALARGYDAASEAARSAEESMRKVQEASERGAEAMTDVFMSVLDGSKSAKQAVADLLMQMARVQMQKAMMGLAGSGGAVGGFFSGLGRLLSFDGGGYTGSAPRSGGLDGKGGFMAMLHPRETVVDHTKARGSASSSDPVKVDVEVHLSPDLEGRILEQAGQQSAQISQRVVMAYDQQMPGRVQAINANPRRR